MAEKGRRLLWTKPGTVVVEEYEIPAVGSDEVLIQTEMTLISPGTERAHFLAMENTPQTFPRTPEGYNNVGKIIAIGENVEG
ncbi:MAG: alcohol dehydrogenase, partial [Planctomycetes bacterium]|nr:alcohol dehydrogenase [Planctomycetota bacterium]